MLKRKAYEQLVSWSEDTSGKALLVTGARQVGKSYLIHHLGEERYQRLVEINLYENGSAREALAHAADADDFLRRVSLFADGPLVEGDTLIFVDEIQELPDVLTMAKFLAADGRYDFAFSGSLLGIALKGVRSYPVGSLESVTMHPLDFEEFCWANGVSDEALATVRAACRDEAPVPDYLHDALLSYFRSYVVVGGMPEVVERFLRTRGDFASVRQLQAELVEGYGNDISKYASNRALNVRAIFDQLPLQLDRASRRFVLNSVDEKARYEGYRQDFVWLVNAGVALKTNLVAEPVSPLHATERPGSFKLYESDTGMLVSRYPQGTARAVYLDDSAPNLGGVYENAVAQELSAQGRALYYYAGKKRGEVDFLVESDSSEVVPIEVKSGRNVRAHASLDALLEDDTYDIRQGVVLSRLNVERAGKVLYLPWYALFCLPSLLSADEGSFRMTLPAI